jgi:hypothetical protein
MWLEWKHNSAYCCSTGIYNWDQPIWWVWLPTIPERNYAAKKAGLDIHIIYAEFNEAYTKDGHIDENIRVILNACSAFYLQYRAYPGRPREWDNFPLDKMLKCIYDPLQWYVTIDHHHKTLDSAGALGRDFSHEVKEIFKMVCHFSDKKRNLVFEPPHPATPCIQQHKACKLAAAVYTPLSEYCEPSLMRKEAETIVAKKENRSKAAEMVAIFNKYAANHEASGQASKLTASMAGHLATTGEKYYNLNSDDPEEHALSTKAYLEVFIGPLPELNEDDQKRYETRTFDDIIEDFTQGRLSLSSKGVSGTGQASAKSKHVDAMMLAIDDTGRIPQYEAPPEVQTGGIAMEKDTQNPYHTLACEFLAEHGNKAKSRQDTNRVLMTILEQEKALSKYMPLDRTKNYATRIFQAGVESGDFRHSINREAIRQLWMRFAKWMATHNKTLENIHEGTDDAGAVNPDSGLLSTGILADAILHGNDEHHHSHPMHDAGTPADMNPDEVMADEEAVNPDSGLPSTGILVDAMPHDNDEHHHAHSMHDVGSTADVKPDSGDDADIAHDTASLLAVSDASRSAGDAPENPDVGAYAIVPYCGSKRKFSGWRDTTPVPDRPDLRKISNANKQLASASCKNVQLFFAIKSSAAHTSSACSSSDQPMPDHHGDETEAEDVD